MVKDDYYGGGKRPDPYFRGDHYDAYPPERMGRGGGGGGGGGGGPGWNAQKKRPPTVEGPRFIPKNLTTVLSERAMRM